MNRAKKPNTRESEGLLREVYITSAFPSRCTNATRWKCSGICCAGDDCTQGSPVCASLDAHTGKNTFLTYERVCHTVLTALQPVPRLSTMDRKGRAIKTAEKPYAYSTELYHITSKLYLATTRSCGRQEFTLLAPQLRSHCPHHRLLAQPVPTDHSYVPGRPPSA